MEVSVIGGATSGPSLENRNRSATMTKPYKKILPATALLASIAFSPLHVLAAAEVYELEPLVVSGDLLQSPSDRLPSSATIFRAGDLSASGEQHFEELLGRMPNVNWTGGTSRPRFFQIRGIGENSQFGNEIPASSVGFMIDGIDFTGIATVAGLFDVQQVEILRGPQAAAFGANAMAGMVIVTTSPTGAGDGKAELTAGNDGLISAGLATGGVLGDSGIHFRASVHHYQDDGFRRNHFLQSDKTNRRSEWSSRVKAQWNPVKNLSLDLNLMYFDFDNGYDVWALDNDSFNTSTDKPGEDNQQTLAVGLKAVYHWSDSLDISYSVSATDSELLYSYDWDWSNPDELRNAYEDEVYWGTDITHRTRDVWSNDLRVNSRNPDGPVEAWVAGIYTRDFEEEQAYFGIDSTYATRTVSAYAQARILLGDALALTAAGRIESSEIDYTSSNPWAGDPAPLMTALGSREHPWGGKIALEFTPDKNHLFYLSIDRGYKAGGVNLDDEVPLDFRVYGTETLENYELGWRSLLGGNRLRNQVTLFYMDRDNIQVDSSIQLGDGNTFALYKDNAASGQNYGLELELEYLATTRLALFATLGILNTRFDDYSYIDPSNPSASVVMDGADQPYAPRYTYSIGADYRLDNGLFLGATLEGKDDYLFDVINNQSIDASNLVRLRAGYRKDDWALIVWVNNLLDERYDVRGFYFANEPPYYDTPKKWVSQGAPRRWGISVRREF